jgi:hypothetical protein
VLGVTGPNVPGERLSAVDRRVEIFLSARHLIEEQVAKTQFADLVGSDSAVKFPGHPLDATPKLTLAIAGAGKRHVVPWASW